MTQAHVKFPENVVRPPDDYSDLEESYVLQHEAVSPSPSLSQDVLQHEVVSPEDSPSPSLTQDVLGESYVSQGNQREDWRHEGKNKREFLFSLEIIFSARKTH